MIKTSDNSLPSVNNINVGATIDKLSYDIINPKVDISHIPQEEELNDDNIGHQEHNIINQSSIDVQSLNSS